MDNIFTLEQIKNSVEYKWRFHQIKVTLFCWLFTAIITFIGCFFDLSTDGILLIWFILVFALGIILFIPLVVFSFIKARYLIRKYKDFEAYEVTLDRINNSFIYRGASYYTVSFIHKGVRKYVDTNPYFQTYFGAFDLDFNTTRK